MIEGILREKRMMYSILRYSEQWVFTSAQYLLIQRRSQEKEEGTIRLTIAIGLWSFAVWIHMNDQLI